MIKKVVFFTVLFILLIATSAHAAAAPTISLSSPAAGTTSHIDNVTFEYVPTTATTSGAFISCTIYLSMGTMELEDGTNTVSKSATNSFVEYLSNGNWTWYVECSSNDSNTSGVSASRTLIVDKDNDPPVITLDLSSTQVNDSTGYF